MNNGNFSDDVIDINPKSDKKIIISPKSIIIGICVLIFVMLLLNSFFILADGEVGVVIRLGKVSHQEEQPGIHLKMPLVDKVEKVNTSQIHMMEYGFKTVKTGTETSEAQYEDINDQATIIIDAANNNASIALINFAIQYKINNPIDYLFRVDDVEGTLELVLEEAIRNAVEEITFDDAKKNKEIIDQEVLPRVQEKMDEYGTGLYIVSAKTQNLEFLPSVETAYQQKENANQYKNSKLEEAEKYNNTIIPEANAEAIKLEEEAKAYEKEIIAKAVEDVAQFNALYEEYKNNPDIVKEKYYIEAMNEFILNNEIIIDGTENGSIYKFYNMDDSQNAIKQEIVE